MKYSIDGGGAFGCPFLWLVCFASWRFYKDALKHFIAAYDGPISLQI